MTRWVAGGRIMVVGSRQRQRQRQGARLSHSFVLPSLTLPELDDGWGFKGSTVAGASEGGLDSEWGSPGWLGSTARGFSGLVGLDRWLDSTQCYCVPCHS